MEGSAITQPPWKICCLTSESAVNDAKALLYNVYIKELGWMFNENNPTGFAITEDTLGRKLLTDDLDSQSLWFGAYDGDQIVAVLRLVHRNTHGQLDITRYPSSQKSHIKLITDKPNTAEVQRCAVLQRYRKTSAFLCLLEAIVSKANQKNIGLIATTPIASLCDFLVNRCHGIMIDNSFHYSDECYGACKVIYVPIERQEKFLNSVAIAIKARLTKDEVTTRISKGQNQLRCKL